ncbi:glycosyltransferase [Variovorax sp. J22P271]|uniref:glycosyltransferase n=1 Tax=Variovorax davisae TaxID=3053515 RepID=UPI002574924C|nr:glycosyltransferase [Variovorax sp. J22P271]MDM0032156.1 glycosyltransferase [Variovorax sp. J22P271]
MTHLVVFSHLRWDFVFQRPQHLLSQLAHRFPVLFVEEPIPGAAHASLERIHPCAGVEVLRPHLTGKAKGFHDSHIVEMQALIADYLHRFGIDDYGLWFYTPMAVPLASGLTPRVIVYDCMDELAAFKDAPRQLIQRENALFKQCDLVFTGGISLFESKQSRHSDVHCFPSSVDAAHFAGASAHRAMPNASPTLGYFGVIDERLDLGLIETLACERPQWRIQMVGPVAKIDPASLPRCPNIEWSGQRRYEELPTVMENWDVCLLPFALNESTRYISPTKTLEYLAADKPAVSTPVRDVVRGYSGIVAIAATPWEFIEACEKALARTTQERSQDRVDRAAIVARTSWLRTAKHMGQLIEARLVASSAPANDASTFAARQSGRPAAAEAV